MTTIALAHRLKNIQPSATLALSARANQLKAQGKDILNLTTGEPDFDTPEHIKDAAHRAISEGFTKYTAVDGMPSLKKAIVRKFETENNLKFLPSQIIVSNGCKHAIYNLAQALLNPGDEVIIPAPYWVSYPDIVYLADGKPVIIPTSIDQHFKITATQLENAITPKTKLVIFNSPSNPSGMVYNQQELNDLAEVLLKHPHVFIASDDIYERILWTKESFHNILNVCPDLADRTVILNGVSKTYAMTGWRIGYAAGPQNLITAMSNIQSQSTSNPNSIAQVAAQIALESDQTCIQEMCKIYHQRHQLVFNLLNEIPRIKVLPADGAFYSFPCIEAILKNNNLRNDVDLAEFLLNDAGVAVIPGSAFGCPGYLRLSYATDEKTLTDALLRMKYAFAGL